mgnify:CR=1 FL=1
MKSYRKVLYINYPKRRGFVNITFDVADALKESGIKEGLILVNAMNITASVFINDNESGLHSDFERWLEKLAPEKPYSQYAHNGFEDNADAHGYGQRGRRRRHQRQTGFRNLGTDFLRRIRRNERKKGSHKNHRRIKFIKRAGYSRL